MDKETREKVRLALAQVVGAGHVYADDTALEAVARDETGDRFHLPELVVKPADSHEVSGVLKVCNSFEVPVVPRGGGSGVSGGALALKGGVVLCLERLNKVLAIDRANMILRVQSGAITGEVQRALLEQGLCLPPDPGSRDWCQIGGNLAEMAAGPKSVKYGAFRDYVLDLEVVLADGTLTRTGAAVRKMACGYNLTQLLLGSEGTLAVITEAVFKLVPAPKASLVVRLAFEQVADAGKMICQVFEAGLTPSELEFMDRDAIEVTSRSQSEKLGSQVEALLWIGFDGRDEEQLLADAERVAELAEEQEVDALIATDPEQERNLWRYRHAVGEAVIEYSRFRDVDVCFPRSKLAEVVEKVKAIGAELGFRSVIFGHSGDGNLHVQILRETMDDATWTRVVEAGTDAIYAHVTSLGGALSGEHGVGCTLTPYLHHQYNPIQLGLMRGIKQLFDPKGILNPGKIIP